MHFPVIDGSVVDILSFMSGVAYVPYRRFVTRNSESHLKYKIISRKTGIDFSNGAALLPLVLLPLCIFSSEILKHILDASKFTLAVAGVCGVLAILED